MQDNTCLETTLHGYTKSGARGTMEYDTLSLAEGKLAVPSKAHTASDVRMVSNVTSLYRLPHKTLGMIAQKD
jgi:hypothetical protein